MFDEIKYKNKITYLDRNYWKEYKVARMKQVDSLKLTRKERDILVDEIEQYVEDAKRQNSESIEQEEKVLMDMFRNDAEKYHDFQHLFEETKSLIHRKAWQEGHSSGLYEVWQQYYDLVEIAISCSEWL